MKVCGRAIAILIPPRLPSAMRDSADLMQLSRAIPCMLPYITSQFMSRVKGDRPERWIKQTDFTNEEAIGYLADRLAKLGVENELFKQGAKPGDTVVIGEDDGVVFDWEPTMMAGAELLVSPVTPGDAGQHGTGDGKSQFGGQPRRAHRAPVAHPARSWPLIHPVDATHASPLRVADRFCGLSGS